MVKLIIGHLIIINCLLWEAWQKASDVAHAYSIGRLESAAALNLFKEIDEAVSDQLGQLVKRLSVKTCPFCMNK